MDLHAINLVDDATRQCYRTHAARLLRLLRQSRMRRSDPVEVLIVDPADRLSVALWGLGALKRTAVRGGVWLNDTNGWPVVRDPVSLQYLTVDPARPLAPAQPFPYPRLSYMVEDQSVYLVQ